MVLAAGAIAGIVIAVVVVVVIAVVVPVVLLLGNGSSGPPPTDLVTVPEGGLGTATLPSGKVLIGNNTDPITATKTAPVSGFVGITDSQSLSNKSVTDSAIGTGNTLVSVSAPIPVNSGGTGRTTLTTNAVLVGDGTNPIMNSTLAPTGEFVGETDTQTLTNKTLSNATITSLTTPFAVSVGGTGGTSFTAGKVLQGNGTSPFIAVKDAPTSNFMGTTDTQTVTNKTFSTGTIIGSLTTPMPSSSGGTGVASASANSFVATDGSSNITFLPSPLQVAEGGTGLSSVTNSTFVTTNGSGVLRTDTPVPSSAVASLTAPSLSNKTLTNCTLNSFSAPIATSSGGLGVAVTTSGNLIVGQGTSPATLLQKPSSAYADTSASQTWTNKTFNTTPSISLSTPLGFANGGTGLSTIGSGTILATNSGGNGYTTVTNPSGAIVGTTDLQTLINKTITSATNNVNTSLLAKLTGNMSITNTVNNSTYNGKTLTTTSASAAVMKYIPKSIMFYNTVPYSFPPTGSPTFNSLIPTTGVGSVTFPPYTLGPGSFLDFEMIAVLQSSDPFVDNYLAGQFQAGFGVTLAQAGLLSANFLGPVVHYIRGRVNILTVNSFKISWNYSLTTTTATVSNLNNPNLIFNDNTIYSLDFSQSQTFVLQAIISASNIANWTWITHSFILQTSDS